LPAVVVVQQKGKPVVGFRLQQAREHLVELEHADASRITVTREPVVGRPDSGPQPEKERAQVHAVHIVADELSWPLGPKELHVGWKCAERVSVHVYSRVTVPPDRGHAVAGHHSKTVAGQPDAAARIVYHHSAGRQVIQRAVQDPDGARPDSHASRLHRFDLRTN